MQLDKSLKLRLLKGEPIPFGPLKIYPPKLDLIAEMGYSRFARITNQLAISETDLLLYNKKQKIQDGETDPLKYLIHQSLFNPTFFFELQFAFLTYVKEEVFLDAENKCFKFIVKQPQKLPNGEIVDMQTFYYLDDKNFPEFQSIIQAINFISDDADEEEIITDNEAMKKKFEKARQRRKLAKAKEKEKKAASHKGEEITFPDIVSSLCAFGIGYTLENVWELTIYQLYDQFYRCRQREGYEEGIQSLLAGADKSKVKLQYWMKSITTD